MGEVLELQLSKTSLIQINSCRIYLQVFHLSDMIEPNGKQFRKAYITGTKLTKQTSSYRWSNQINSSPTAWNLWRKTIKDTFKLTSNYTFPIERQLSNWIVPLNERHMKYQWYFSAASNEIYRQDHQRIERYFFKAQLLYIYITYNNRKI